MKKYICYGILLMLLILGSRTHAMETSLSIHTELELHYKLKAGSLVKFKHAKVSNDDLAIVCFLSNKSGRDHASIIAFRSRGLSWMDVSFHLGLNATHFYIPHTHVHSGPPYGKAFGYYRNSPKHSWSKIKLSDGELSSLVGLHFVKARTGLSVGVILNLHVKGDSILSLNAKARSHKHKLKLNAHKSHSKKANKHFKKAKHGHKKSNGRSKGRGKGKH